MNYRIPVLLFSMCFLISCATRYSPIVTSSLSYGYFSTLDSISVSTAHEVLFNSFNDKYAKKEGKKNIKVIGLKISNYSDSSIQIGKDYFLYSGGKLISPLDPKVLVKKLGQKPATYLFYLLLSPAQLEIKDVNKSKTYQIGLLIGPPLAIGNMLVSNSANEKFYKELLENDIYNKIIKSGETVYGLIGVRNYNFEQIELKK